MSGNVIQFLDCHIETERAKKAKWVSIKNTGMKVDDTMISTQEYKLCLPYFKSDSNPILIKFGYKNHRVCIRLVDEGQKTKKDYFGDSLEQLKALTREIVNFAALYQRTTWFVRGQLIPAIFSMIRSLLISHHLFTKR